MQNGSRNSVDGYKGKEAFLDHKNIGSENHPNLHFFQRG